ncbi:MAG: 50S ribosomal protein L9 [Chitinophagales bacterium]|nr:50S ribosomal protein L9 [Chitinophagales bacterium]MCO5280460.1 50S ribosomal protein L9 [Chitinophagales bacterium]OJV26828.1 MAG: 50S ribosomal protein L9 [Bacteroidetes bacterium 37-13]HRN95318.1 50S ribosomal protein L9 [Chitinophagales bacterium]HRP40143.1 50S ribosomal protein L9 [Chitinophagales bacterium]
MEIILLKDVEKLGYADDMVSVKNGYALNYLIPQGYAVVKNDSNVRELNNRLKVKEKKEAKLLEQIHEITSRLQSSVLKIATKVGSTDKIFGSVTAYHVAEAIRETAKVEVDRRKITIVEGEVKTTGNYTAEVTIGKNNKVTVAFEVVAE